MSKELRQKLFRYETDAHTSRINALAEVEYEQRMHELLDLTERQVKDLFLELIGKDDARTGTNAHIDIEREGRNKLRAELRKKIEEL